MADKYTFNDIYIGTVLKVDRDNRRVGAYIPRLMSALSGNEELEYQLPTNNGLTNVSFSTNMNKSVTKINYIWLKSWFYKQPLPNVGSKIQAIFIDGNLTTGFWKSFDPNGDYETIPEESHLEQFKININGSEKTVYSDSTLSIQFPDYFDIVSNTDETTKNTTFLALILGQSYNALESEVEKKAYKTELDSYATKEYVQTNAPQETKESIEEKLGAWFEEDGGEADGEVYTKAESDARYLRGGFEYCGLMEWDGTNEVKIYEMQFDSPKREVFIYGACTWDNGNRGDFKIIITNEKQPYNNYGISYYSSSSNAEECFHIHNVCGNYVCDINTSNNHLLPNALKRCYMRNLLTDQNHEDVGLITNLKIEITTDLVRIDGVQKWYIFGK